MKKINFKFFAPISLISIGAITLYKYSKTRQVEKDTKQYILNIEKSPNDIELVEEEPKRKYITLFKGKNNR